LVAPEPAARLRAGQRDGPAAADHQQPGRRHDQQQPGGGAGLRRGGPGTIRESDGALLDLDGNVIPPGTLLTIPNVAPDAGLSAPFNSWFTFFGQFFDHGLDLVNKSATEFVMMPLQPDDPLYVAGSHTNFMVVSRVTQGRRRQPTNATTPFVDQNQTYTSHPSHQVFLREYVLDASGHPVATGNLLNHADGGLPTWADVKAQALHVLGIQLDDLDVLNLPLVVTDPYGNFIPGADGMPQLVISAGPPPVMPPARLASPGGRQPGAAHQPRLPERHRAQRRAVSTGLLGGRRRRDQHRCKPPAPTTTSCWTATSSPATAAATRTSR
jgi:hypothetical protein